MNLENVSGIHEKSLKDFWNKFHPIMNMHVVMPPYQLPLYTVYTKFEANWTKTKISKIIKRNVNFNLLFPKYNDIYSWPLVIYKPNFLVWIHPIVLLLQTSAILPILCKWGKKIIKTFLKHFYLQPTVPKMYC